MNYHDKFLISWIQGVSKEHLFLLVWLSVGIAFVLAILASRRRAERRNFREEAVHSPDRRNLVTKPRKKLGTGKRDIP